MQVIKIYPKGFASNTYLVTEDGKRAVAIDPAQPRVLKEAEKRGLNVEYVLLTHGHFDHTGGCAALQAQGAKVGCLEAEKPLATGEENLAAYFGVCDSHLAKKLIRKVMTQPELGECQPYFAHYLFEAVYKNWLREEYTLGIAGRWKPVPSQQKWTQKSFKKRNESYSFFCFRKTAAFIPRFA